MDFFEVMIMSGVLFVWKFDKDDLVLNKIDVEFFNWIRDGFSFGGWCVGLYNNLCLV